MRMKVIVLIDDEEDFCRVIKEHLEGISDFEVFTATNGKAGIDLVKKIKPDLIALDILMPGMDGFQVLERLKKDNATMDIPVIILSGKDDDKSKITAAKLYAEMYLTKPVDAKELKEKIDEVFKWRGGK